MIRRFICRLFGHKPKPFRFRHRTASGSVRMWGWDCQRCQLKRRRARFEGSQQMMLRLASLCEKLEANRNLNFIYYVERGPA